MRSLRKISRAGVAVLPSRLRASDLAGEAVAGMVQRPGRSILTMLGTVLGVGAFVAILGFTATAGGQIDRRFSVLSATQVNVSDVGSGDPRDPGPISFPQDADDRMRRLRGVVEAGVWWALPLRQPTVSAGIAAGSRPVVAVSLLAASPGALRAMEPRLAAGMLYDSFHDDRREAVAVLGAAAARQLGISRLDAEPAVFVNGTPYTIVGIIDNVQRMPEALTGIFIPSRTAYARYGEPAPQARASMLIATQLGAAQLIAREAPLALRPDAPGVFKVVAPPDPATLRSQVGSDLNVLFLLLAGICLVIGAVGIANTTLVAVLERQAEIGLRRSLGARPRHIAAQFLSESVALGTLGGLVGSSLGVVAVVAVAVGKQWTAVLEPWAVLPAPFVGSAVGLLAGLYPALRAAWIEPVEALRR